MLQIQSEWLNDFFTMVEENFEIALSFLNE